jgi:hypothetical protein
VGGVAAWVSYLHMRSVALMLGEADGAEFFYPMIIDGMMLVATISLIELGRLARTVEQIEAAALPAEVDPQVTARRKAAAAKAAETRRKNAARRTRKRTPTVEEVEALVDADNVAPVSPAPAGR